MNEGWQRIDGLSRELALAVELKDPVRGGRPRGDPAVSAAEADDPPYRNRSGFYLFFDLPETSVTVEVDGGDLYRDRSKTVDLTAASFDRASAVSVSLDPTPGYPFPAGLTRVRGTVLDGEATVAGASVSVENHSRTVETTEAGEFVYYFDDVSQDDIERFDPKPKDDTNVVTRYYKPGGAHPTFHVDGPAGAFDQSVKVEVGQLTTRDLTYPED